MNQKSYDAGLLFGVVMLFCGCVSMWDWPTGFVVIGMTVILLTLIGALLSRKG